MRAAEETFWLVPLMGLALYASGFLMGSAFERFRVWISREEDALEHDSCRCRERK